MTQANARAALDGRYELIELIGTGGMAEVWRARDTRLQRDVAVKLMTGTHDASKARRIAREAKAMAAISHPNVLAVYDYGEDAAEEPFIVTELVDGPDLHHYLADHGALPTEKAVEVMRGILSGIDVAHQAGIVHGDLKPANVLMASDGPKVGDFGVARVLEEETGTTTAAATPTFAAPEVLKGERPTKESDIYSAACLAFQLLTGRAPYVGSNGWEVAGKHIQDPVPHAREFVDISTDLDAAIHRGMAKEPHRRFTSAAQFASAIREVTATVPVDQTVPIAPASDATVTLGPRPDAAKIAVLGPFAGIFDRIRGGVRRGPAWLPLAVIVPLLLLLALLAFSTRPPSLVAVPDVRGQTVTDAVAHLQKAGLKPDVAYRPITSGQAGLVVETIPGPKANVTPNSSVHVIATALAMTPTPAPTPAPTKAVVRNVAPRVARTPGKKRHKG